MLMAVAGLVCADSQSGVGYLCIDSAPCYCQCWQTAVGYLCIDSAPCLSAAAVMVWWVIYVLIAPLVFVSADRLKRVLYALTALCIDSKRRCCQYQQTRKLVSSKYATQVQQQRPESPTCLLYTSPSPRDISGSRMPSSA